MNIIYIKGIAAIDYECWPDLTPKEIRQIRARNGTRFSYARPLAHIRIVCPKCGEEMAVPIEFFTIKKNGEAISDEELTCAESSKAHAYRGGCGYSWYEKIKRL